jgi:hypothetical protein
VAGGDAAGVREFTAVLTLAFEPAECAPTLGVLRRVWNAGPNSRKAAVSGGFEERERRDSNPRPPA